MTKTTLKIKSNGSILVSGDFEIVDAEGNKYGLGDRETVSLCRCGLSKNMPFCDGNHKEKFTHEAIAFDFAPKKTT